jgi:hypothetical protein
LRYCLRGFGPFRSRSWSCDRDTFNIVLQAFVISIRPNLS